MHTTTRKKLKKLVYTEKKEKQNLSSFLLVPQSVCVKNFHDIFFNDFVLFLLKTYPIHVLFVLSSSIYRAA